MNTGTKRVLTLAGALLLSGCMMGMQPQATDFQRNMGPGSSASGRPSNDGGIGTPGDEMVPGVSAAGPTIGH